MKWIHLNHHRGCEADLQYVGEKLDVRIDHLWSDANYNIGLERARKLWRRWQGIFENYDGAITSDTAPLARVFLEAGWTKPLIIWVCTRFDYTDQATNDCGFPDAAFYDMFRAAAKMPNVRIVSYTAYEHMHARAMGVTFPHDVVKPTGLGVLREYGSQISPRIKRPQTFFIPPYHNDTHLLDLQGQCRNIGIKAYRGRYSGPADLKAFKGIIHIPYAWSNLALFENWQRGLTYFIPSHRLLLEMSKCREFFWSPPWRPELLSASEWYDSVNAPGFVYFDSWEDLQVKTNAFNPGPARSRVISHATESAAKQLSQWSNLLGGW